MIRTQEEWQKLFPVMELMMNKRGMKVTLSDNKASLHASLPAEMLDAIASQWQAFKDGTATKDQVFSRHYTGELPDISNG